MSGALEGIRVLDLTRILAGPYATMMLADLGAEVIKVEIPGKGDDTRGWGPPFVNGESSYFMSINRNKKSLTLDLKNERGKEILTRLIERSDIVAENFRPGTMEKLGFGYDRVREINPRAVFASISGFGHTGPLAERPGYDVVIQGEGGVMSLTGEPEGPPAKVGASIADITAGMLACHGILAALVARERTGTGQKVDIGMLDGQVALLTYQGSSSRPARPPSVSVTPTPASPRTRPSGALTASSTSASETTRCGSNSATRSSGPNGPTIPGTRRTPTG